MVDLVPNNDCSGALTLSVLRILVGTPQPTKPLFFSGPTSRSNFSKSEFGPHNGNIWKSLGIHLVTSASSSSKASTKDLTV